MLLMLKGLIRIVWSAKDESGGREIASKRLPLVPFEGENHVPSRVQVLYRRLCSLRKSV